MPTGAEYAGFDSMVEKLERRAAEKKVALLSELGEVKTIPLKKIVAYGKQRLWGERVYGGFPLSPLDHHLGSFEIYGRDNHGVKFAVNYLKNTSLKEIEKYSVQPDNGWTEEKREELEKDAYPA